MANNRALAIVTALVLTATARGGFGADYSVDQLMEVERLLVARNFDQLCVYLEDNPVLYIGDDPLSVELRGLVTKLSADPFSQCAFRGGELTTMADIY